MSCRMRKGLRDHHTQENSCSGNSGATAAVVAHQDLELRKSQQRSVVGGGSTQFASRLDASAAFGFFRWHSAHGKNK